MNTKQNHMIRRADNPEGGTGKAWTWSKLL